MRILLVAWLMVAGAYAFAAEGRAWNNAVQAHAAASAGGSLEQMAGNSGAAFSGGHAAPEVLAVAGRERSSHAWNAQAAAPRPSKEVPEPGTPRERRTLKILRAGGIVLATAGGGMFVYSVLAMTSGPVGWAAALVFLGGMSAYWAHNKLKGKDILKG